MSPRAWKNAMALTVLLMFLAALLMLYFGLYGCRGVG